jgi:hypothetical protein
MGAKMNVYFTIDTESSMGGAWRWPERRPISAVRHVFCRIGGKDYGIPLVVDMMSEFGFRGTFFVETLATRCLGESDTSSIFEYLLRHGQDVQLHIHPTFRFYSEWLGAQARGIEYQVPTQNDLIGHFSESMQMDLLSEAAQLFERFAGYPPKAFRAGCYAGSRSMLRCLCKLGVQVDSSFNPCFHPKLSFPDGPLPPNVVQKVEGVWEIPVTVARTKLPEGYGGLKFADCTPLSFAEIRVMLDVAYSFGQRHFVIVFHSFSGVKPKDETYVDMRPNQIVIRRLRKMFQYLAENSDKFSVSTMGAVTANPDSLECGPSNPAIAELGLAISAIRKAVQLWNTPYWT